MEFVVPLSAKNPVKLQFVPCMIKHNGPANVKEYFDGSTITEEGKLKVSLHGRALIGMQIALPKSYCGVIGRKKEGAIVIEGSFCEFKYFNHDSTPSNDDEIPELLNYCSYMKTLNQL